MNRAVRAVADLLADDAPHHTGPDFGKASPFGLLVIVLLLLGTVFLVWSMNRQLKKVPSSFDRENPAADQAADAGTVGGDDTELDQSGDTAEPRGGPDG